MLPATLLGLAVLASGIAPSLQQVTLGQTYSGDG